MYFLGGILFNDFSPAIIFVNRFYITPMWSRLLLLTGMNVFFFQSFVYSQDCVDGPEIICFSPGEKFSLQKNHSSRITSAKMSDTEKGSVFNVDAGDLPEDAIPAVTYAINIWENFIRTTIPINIKIAWTALSNNALASSQPTKLYRNFNSAEFQDDWYPVALAEKLEGRELNGKDEPDIFISINNAISWHFGTDAHPPADKTDFTTILLHEIAHGLGFLSSAKVADSLGYFDEEGHMLSFDEFIYNDMRRLINTLPSYSIELHNAFTSNNLFFTTGGAMENRVKLYAPSFFEPLSSISHLDESIYRTGDENSLMTPIIQKGEAIHSLGIALPDILGRLGWEDKSVSLNIFPNPSNGILNFNTTSGLTINNLRIIDSTGAIVAEMNSGCTSFTISTSGFFIVIADTNHGRIVKRVIIL